MNTAATSRLIVRTIQRTALAAAACGMTLAWIAPDADTIDLHLAPKPAATAPSWTADDAERHPACVEAGTQATVPSVIIVRSRDLQRTEAMPYTDASVAKVHATWDNDDPADDLFTIGACR